LGGVMALPKNLEKRRIGDDTRIEDHQNGLAVPGEAAAHLLIGRIGGHPRRIAGSRGPDPFAELPEPALGPPEAAEGENRGFEPGRKWWMKGTPVDEMVRGGRKGFPPARKSPGGGGHRGR